MARTHGSTTTYINIMCVCVVFIHMLWNAISACDMTAECFRVQSGQSRLGLYLLWSRIEFITFLEPKQGI
jgi:hypothetical protein